MAGACALDRSGRFDGAADGGSSAVPQGGTAPAAGGAGGDDAHGGGGGRGGGGQGGLGGGGAAPTDQQCPPGEFATGYGETGVLQCAPIRPAAFAAVNEHCSLYLGWRDSCDGCSDPPTQWGQVGAASCTDGAGVDNSCITATLGATDVRLFGLSPDGNVDGNDKFHMALRCAAAPETTPVAGPCPSGTFASALSGTNVTCVTALDALTTYVRSSCEGYFGWRDACDDCTSEPSKWGTFGDGACDVGTGTDCTCATHTLGESVELFGLNTDFSVDDGDKFYVGLQCSGAVASGGVHDHTCPAGELVAGVRANGMVECASPAPAAEEAIQAGCFLYLGWRDSCDDCTDPPAKWGRVSHALCENGEGADNTCTTPTLAATTLPLFGLNTDGGVNGDDKFYVGLKCE